LPLANLFGIGLAAALSIALLVFDIAPPGKQILTTLVLLWIAIKLPVNLAWLMLASPRLPPERRRPGLYRLWLLALVSGGILAAMSLLAHFSAVSRDVLTSLDRFLMLYLLLITVPVLMVRNLMVQRLTSYYGQRFWVIGKRVISALLPVSLFAMSIIGLAGYLNLAWEIGVHVLILVGILGGWLLAQGFLNDLASWLKQDALNRSVKNYEAVRDVVSSSQRLFSVLLLFGATLVLAEAYNLAEDEFARAWRTLGLTLAGVLAVYEATFVIFTQLSPRESGTPMANLIRKMRAPLGLVLVIAAAQLTLPNVDLPAELTARGEHLLLLLQIAAVTWLLMRLVSLIDQVSESRYRGEFDKNFGARRAHTQIRVLRQALHVTVFLVGTSLILMTFPAVQRFGAGLLASAGAAGLVIGIAARPLFENLIAGIQIGLTQPIRTGDVVIVEGEWGKIEEIAATYVVVHIWDDRRLVLPLKYFNETPFQNWTRNSSHLLGTVFIYTDYTFPVEAGRKALKRILDDCELWDGRVWVLQVTDATEQTMELRALMSAPDAPTAWDLRCHVREKLIEFLRENYPKAMPRTRAVLTSDDEAPETRRQYHSRVVLEKTQSEPA
jgi:small-conductance mechanosensitive channel